MRPGSSWPISLRRSGRLDTYATLHLLRELVKRDFRARFAGSALGLAWAVLQPLSLVILYWFVFTFMIPGGRAGVQGESYVYYLVAGLLPWLGINEALVRSATSIVDQGGIVRRLPLRAEVLVVVPSVAALVFECIALAMFIPAAMLMGGGSLPRLWLLPVALALQLALQVGAGLVLAVTYVLFRDMAQVLSFVLSVVFYLSPILYQPTGRFERIFSWNPLTPLLGLFRSALLAAPLPDDVSIVFLVVVAIGTLVAGMLVFRRARPALVDLI